MIRNYFIITLRNLLRNKVYAVINIAGLAIGITCSILILLWVFDELSFDAFFPKADRLYQLWVQSRYEHSFNDWRSVSLPTYEALKSAHASIKNTAVADWGGEHLLSVGEMKIYKRGYYVSEEFLTMFEFPMLTGNPVGVLNDASSIVITQRLARALFGNEDPINKVIRVDDKGDLKVAGILKDIPENSSFQFDCLLPYKYWRSINPWVIDNEDNWGNYSFQVFVELKDKQNLDGVNKAISPILYDHGQTDLEKKLFLYPLLRWRLFSSFDDGKEKGGLIDFVQLFSLIAVFIVLIACINFMNLATARSERRALEVGIRKSIGSARHDLIFQFLAESFLISVIAYALAILTAQLLLPAYNNLVDKHLTINYLSGRFWYFSICMIFITGLIAGSYPAFYLSSFRPVKVLKGKILAGRNSSLPRKILIILQFGFSVMLIIGTLVIYRQIKLVKNRELGYNQENLIMVERNDELDKNYETIKNELLRSGVAESVTYSNSPITEINSNNFLDWPGKPEEQHVIFTTIVTDYDYARTMGINMLVGRDFSRDHPSDSSAILINKAALDIMNLTDPIGTQLELWGKKRTLIGVLDNVLMGSPYQEVKPMFVILDDWGGYITIRIRKTNNLPASLEQIGDIFGKFNPAYPFEYRFADLEFDKKFKSINLTGHLANLFAGLALLITGLGLLGLASYMAEQRTKEIGIRKVMGATVMSIVTLISGDFSKLVIFAFIISAPLSWWLLKKYLERYPVHTEIQFWLFPVTGIFILAFALLIVIAQTLRAAHANPVNSLRNE